MAIRVDNPRSWALIEATFAVAAWGLSFIATKLALRDVSPVTVVWTRFTIGVFILGAVVIKRGQFIRPRREELAYFSFLGFIGITFHQWLQSTGLVTSQASTTAWIVAATPIFIALLGSLVLKERLGWLRTGGILLAASGVILVVTNGEIAALTYGRFGQAGDILILISALNWAVFSVLSRYGLRRHSAAWMMFYVMVMGWLFTSILLFLGPGLTEIRQFTTYGWMGVGFLGIACSGLAYIAWYDALHALPASQVGVFLYLEPIVTLIAASIVLSEPIHFTSLIGGGIILLGVGFVNRPQR